MNDPVASFTAEARRYCALLEEESNLDSSAFAGECLQSVVRLVEKVLLLPTTEVANLRDSIGHEEWSAVRNRVAGTLSRDEYWKVFDPLELELPAAIRGSLSDDLAGIWGDLRAGLRTLDKDPSGRYADVVWEWRSSFESHWGRHATGAITGLTALCFWQVDDDA